MNDDQERATKSIGEAVENAVSAALKIAHQSGQLDQSIEIVDTAAAQARSAAEAAMSFCFATGSLAPTPPWRPRVEDVEGAERGEEEEEEDGEESDSDDSEEEDEDDDNSIFTSDEDDIQSEDDQESSDGDGEENADGDGDESGEGAAEPRSDSSPKRARLE
jgi:ribonuclease E